MLDLRSLAKYQSIRSRVLLPWILLLLLAMVLGGYWVHQWRYITEVRHHAELHHQGAQISKSIQAAAMRRWADVMTYRLNSDQGVMRRILGVEQTIKEQIKQLKTLFKTSAHAEFFMEKDEKTFLNNFVIARKGLDELYLDLAEAINASNEARQRQLLELLAPKISLDFATLDDLTAYHRMAERVASERRAQVENRLWSIFFGSLLLLMLAGLVMAVLQTRAIARPLIDLANASRRIEQSEAADFSEFLGKGEIAQLGQALSSMVASLRQANRDLVTKRDELAKAYAEVENKVRVRTRELQQRSDELETANKDLENFSYSVSHDLRAPLRAIDGFIAILSEEQADRLDEEGRRMFGIVADNARKMGNLIDDILAFSRAGRLQIEMVEIDMQALVRDVWSSLSGLIQEGHQVDFRLEQLPPAICDPRAIRQVWQNLLGNAIKFSRDRNPAVIEVGAVAEDGFTRYSVKDNGVGFNNEYKSKLFVLFQRLHGMDEFDGTGVGLAIVKRFVQKHGGEVEADAVAGQGAHFSFSLPKAPPSSPG